MPRPDRIMEHKNNHNHNNGTGNGFLLGVIVGVLVTLLFTTKRGRTLLKEVMEKGIDKFANLEELMRETEKEYNDEEDEDGDDFIPSEPIEAPEPQKTKKEEAPITQPAKAEPSSEQIGTVGEETVEE